MSRRRLFAVKIASGITFVLGPAAIALAIVCAWAAMSGTHASPFEWDMTTGAWRSWIAVPLLYLGGFATGIYQARWIGTRLFPLLTSFVFFAGFLSGGEAIPFWVFLFLCLLADGVFLAVIHHLIRTRDFS